eukprot:TRINITY_DN11919_c0_g1_i1.p1 TRINITY_DN11919_c0_g1~~TRINITY_DN11919_c0_g1_i1.p1  ORF type:complete len:134 (-),score=13.73 TRINITY_DN11919_c0_g1_i1:59-460(-)
MNLTWLVHVLTLASAGVFITVGVLNLIGVISAVLDPISLILAIYFFLFGLILLSAELNWKWYRRWFGFASYTFGRGLFVCLMAVLAYQGTSGDYATVMLVLMFCLIGLGLFLVIYSCISGNAKKELSGEVENE